MFSFELLFQWTRQRAPYGRMAVELALPPPLRGDKEASLLQNLLSIGWLLDHVFTISLSFFIRFFPTQVFPPQKKGFFPVSNRVW